MKRQIIWIRISAIALIFLGIIHLAATIMVLPMFQNLARKQLSVFLFMYLATGIGTMLPGLISVFTVRRLNEKDRNAWLILLICSIYAVILGIGAIVSMMNNPFAYLGFIIGLSLLIPTSLVKKFL